MSNRLKKASEDFRFLLNRGYKRSSALKFVSDRYMLNKNQRNFLVRAIFSAKEADSRKKKLLGLKEIKGKEISVDGYNVLITTENIIKKEKIVLGDDGLLRDTSATFGKYKISGTTRKAVREILSILKEHRPKEINFYFDSMVSKSGELSKLVRRELENFGLRGNAETFKNVDHALKGKEIVCTSDTAIIDKAKRVLDIPYHIAKKYKLIEQTAYCRKY